MKGGMLNLSPGILLEAGSTTTPPAGGMNYDQNPLTVPSSNMVGGGGYGFENSIVADVQPFGGSYFPVSRVSTADMPDNNSRGGNNFAQGGGKRRRRGTKKRRGSAKRRTMKKWRQRGCSKKGGKRK